MPQPAKSRRQKKETSELSWSKDTELLGLVFELQPKTDASLYPQYTIGLHAWLLDQVRSFDPELSAYLHDGQPEKPFTISGLEGALQPIGKEFLVQASQTYRWYVTALSAKVVQWLTQWVKALPEEVALRNVPLLIKSCKIALPATTYKQLWEAERSSSTLKLSFVTPTSFRRKKHHFPLPLPFNVFHSYLRRWNDFSGMPFEQDAFLDWVDENVIVQQVKLESCNDNLSTIWTFYPSSFYLRKCSRGLELELAFSSVWGGEKHCFRPLTGKKGSRASGATERGVFISSSFRPLAGKKCSRSPDRRSYNVI